MFELTVAKFGGTSLADASQVRKVMHIIRADRRRRVVVVSAPGKRHKKDTKVTDLLLEYRDWMTPGKGATYSGQLKRISFRYRAMARALGVEFDSVELKGLYRLTGDALVSRGEYFMAKLLAKALGFLFVDASLLIYFKQDGSVDWASTRHYCSTLLSKLYERGVVIGGFYGSLPDLSVKTFSRGGSDITGAIVAEALGANLYENWTDVSGTLMADPRVVTNPRPIPSMTYQEMLELAHGGANVLHDEAIFPARKAGIPIRICNTNAPEQPGTFIVTDEAAPPPEKGTITGIAARKGVSIVRIEKVGMSNDIGYGWSVLGILKELRISWEHLPSRGESISLVIADEELEGKLDVLKKRIETQCTPDRVLIRRNLGLIYVVGRGLSETPGMLARFALALAEEAVNIRAVDQDDGELSMIFTIDAQDCEKAMQAAYRKFVVHQPPL